MRRTRILGALGTLAALALPTGVHAVPPPDFLFAAGSQIVQAFSIALLLVTGAVAATRDFLKLRLARIAHPRVAAAVGIALLVALAFGAAYGYDVWQKGRQISVFNEQVDVLADVPPTADDLDRLAPLPVASVIPLPSSAPDAGAAFIRSYYDAIGNGRLADAYAMSKRSVPFETFASWYARTTGVTVTDITNIDTSNFSLRLTLSEGAQSTSYAVLMRIAPDAATGYRVVDSQVRIIASTTPTPATTAVPSVTNEQLAALLEASTATILDAREDEEFDIGSIPGSTHIRFADLVAGRWIELPTDRDIQVVCWSGIRGREVATFLRSKGVRAAYLEDGVTGWTAFGGAFHGTIAFSSRYGEERYKRVFSTAQLRDLIAQGVALVDSRPQQRYAVWHIPDSINIPIIYTPTSAMDTILGRVPAGSRVVTVCDDWVSCFDAKVTGIKLEARGHEFLGRFSRLDDFR